jgi:hypothetical protein
MTFWLIHSPLFSIYVGYSSAALKRVLNELCGPSVGWNWLTMLYKRLCKTLVLILKEISADQMKCLQYILITWQCFNSPCWEGNLVEKSKNFTFKYTHNFISLESWHYERLKSESGLRINVLWLMLWLLLLNT